MKAIAEYFRDLAADDRYFGAEPPQPDAAMLHKIAEREIQRRVEAKVQDNGVILRAGSDQALSLASPAAEPTVAPVVAELVEEAVPEPKITIPAEAPKSPMPTVTAVAEASGESVAERLSRLRRAAAEAEAEAMALAAVAKIKPAAAQTVAPVVTAQPMAPAETDFTEDQHADVAPPVATPAPLKHAEVEVPPVEALETVEAPETFDPSEEFEADLRAALTDDPIVEAEPDTAEDDDDDFLASLSETLSAGSEPTTVVAPMAEPAADTTTDEMILASLGQLIEPEDAAVEVTHDAAPVQDAPIDDSTIAMEEPADLTTIDPVVPPVPEEEPAAVRPARPVRRLRVSESPEAAPAPAPAPVVAPASSPQPSPESKEVTAERPKARVIRVRRLSPTGETTADPAPAAAAPAPAATPVRPTRAPKTPQRLGPAGDDSISRLMAEATQQMSGPDNRRRQNAIAHLKAAVAATVAERRATGQGLGQNRDAAATAYREDLARAISPEDRPAPPVSPDARPAPLVLASAQRIDRPATPPADEFDDDEPIGLAAALADPAPAQTLAQPPAPAPARPASARPAPLAQLDGDEEDDEEGADNMFGSELSFAEFADKLGAEDLSKLLEAAAAYVACVEGQDSFTRPQLIRHVNGVSGTAAREDSLRSFGALLRDGRIQRQARGRYTLPEGAEILEEARRIAS